MALPASVPARTHTPEQASIAALANLYRACHLPPPAVLVARDAIHFVRLTQALTRTTDLGEILRLVSIGCLSWVLTLTFLEGQPNGFLMGLSAYISIIALLFVLPSGPGDIHLRDYLHNAARVVVMLMVTVMTGWLTQTSRPTVAVMEVTTLGFLVSGLLRPMRWRSTLYAQARGPKRLFGWTRLRGFRPANALIHARLQSALADEAVRVPQQPQLNRDEARRRVWDVMHDELRRSWVPNGAMPILGRGVGSRFDVAGQVSALAEAGETPSDLPALLRAAIQLDVMAEAVCPLHGLAIVLPAGAPASITAAPGNPQSWRRSRRLPWAAVMPWFDALDDGLAVAIDLAPTDALATWLLARRIVRLPNPAQRTPALEALGVARVAAALRSRPVQVDATGRLFQFGPPEAVSAFVAVRDPVLDADGTPLEHWISVPPHMATAKEAVAWTFQMSEQAYGTDTGDLSQTECQPRLSMRWRNRSVWLCRALSPLLNDCRLTESGTASFSSSYLVWALALQF